MSTPIDQPPIDQPTGVRSGEQINIDQLQDYLVRQSLELAGQLEIEQFPSGFSNLTYLLRMGEQEYVLRRPPVGNQVRSAHDMGREFRVLSQLSTVYPLVPQPLLYCEDDQVLGSPFYIMQRCRGVILRSGRPPKQLRDRPEQVTALCHTLIDNLVDVHQIDYRVAGLEDLGRPHGYVERQVAGWTKRYAQAKTDDYQHMQQLADWLTEHRPSESSAAFIHNDYKYDNLVLDPNELTRIVGVLDWEMATLGDPLMDLGTTLAYWVEPDDPPAEQERAFGPTMLPGSLTRAELVARYAEAAGIQMPAMVFYYTYGLFKLAVIVQQIYARYAAGKTNDLRFAHLNDMVDTLGKRGLQVVQTGKI